jgi:hypothetical protein
MMDVEAQQRLDSGNREKLTEIFVKDRDAVVWIVPAEQLIHVASHFCSLNLHRHREIERPQVQEEVAVPSGQLLRINSTTLFRRCFCEIPVTHRKANAWKLL